VQGYFRLATAQESMDQWQKASETLTMGLAVEPRNKDLLTLKGRVDERLRTEKSRALQEAAEKMLKSGDIAGLCVWQFLRAAPPPPSRLFCCVCGAGAYKNLEAARAVDSGNKELQATFERVQARYEAAEKSRR
jgi:hypothetical protein